jgi:hypothetical protein
MPRVQLPQNSHCNIFAESHVLIPHILIVSPALPIPLFALLCKIEANALLGMVCIDLLLFLSTMS